MAYGRRGYRRGPVRGYRNRARFSSAKMRAPSRSRYASRKLVSRNFRSVYKRLKRNNLNWSNQYVLGGNTSEAFINLGGVSEPPAPFTYSQGPDTDGFVARSITFPPKIDFCRLFFRAGVTFASEDHTYLRNVISASNNVERAPLRRFRVTQSNDVLFQVAPYITSTAAADSGMEVRDFRMDVQHVYCFVLIPKHSGNHYDGAPDNKWLCGANSNTLEAPRQGIDWDVKQSNVGQDAHGTTHRSPIINLSRWKVMKKKVISFPPGVNSRHFRWKWTFSNKDMIAPGLPPTSAFRDYWKNSRMPRLFMVSDAPIAIGSGEYGAAISNFMTVSFTTMGKIYLGDTPVLTTTDEGDAPGDAPLPNLGNAAPVQAMDTE